MKESTLKTGELNRDGMRILAAQTNTKDVVRIEGSVFGGEYLVTKEKGPVALLTAELLDAGTAKRSKDAIRDALAARGASLSFAAQGNRLAFSASCLPEDMMYVLGVIVECLGGAHFPRKEVELAKERAVAELIESKTDTRSQALGAFSRLVFDTSHPSYAVPTDARITAVKKVTQKELVEFRKKIGRSGLVLAIAGDISLEKTLKSALQICSKLGKGVWIAPNTKLNSKMNSSEEALVSIKDKANIDLYMGVALPLTYTDPRFLPCVMLLSLLGGRGLSTGHLMRTIRERDGLTYGIYASLLGLDDGNEGAFVIGATFAPSVFKKGISAVEKEVKQFLSKRIASDLIENKKSEMIGNYLVGLSTTGGLAATLHRVGREGKELSYLEEYPSLLKKITAEDIASVIPLIPLSRLSIAAAGTFSA